MNLIKRLFRKKETNEQCDIHLVGASLPSKDEELIRNMCLSYRHDFGLLPKFVQEHLISECRCWLIAYENNRKLG